MLGKYAFQYDNAYRYNATKSCCPNIILRTKQKGEVLLKFHKLNGFPSPCEKTLPQHKEKCQYSLAVENIQYG